MADNPAPPTGLRSQLVGGVLILSTRRLISNGIALARLFLIVALLAPLDYGLYVMATGLVGYVFAISSLGIGSFLLRCRETPSPARIGTARALSLLIGLLGLTAAALLAPILAAWYDEPALGPMLLVQALGLPLLLLRAVPSSLLERTLDYRRSAAIDLTSELAGFLLALLVVLETRSPWGLILGALLQHLVALLLTGRAMAGRFILCWGWDRAEARELLRFGVEVGMSNWVSQIRTLVNPLLIAKLLGPEAAGIVALAVRVMDIAGFVRYIIWRVFQGGFSRLRSEGRPLAKALDQTVAAQLLAVGGFLAATVAVAPEFVSLLPGRHWEELLPLLPLLAAAMLAGSGFSIYTGALLVLGDNRPVILSSAFTSAIFFGGSWVLLLFWPDVRAYGVAELIAAGAYPLVFFAVRRRLPEVRFLSASVTLALLAGLMALLTLCWSQPLWVRLLLFGVGWSMIALQSPHHRALRNSLRAKARAG